MVETKIPKPVEKKIPNHVEVIDTFAHNYSPGPKNWNESEVKLLKKWAELAASYRVLHDRAHRIFKYRNYCFTIPVIIFSTILGTASFSQGTFPIEYQPYIPMGIGSLNIISGIITTIAQFTRVGELSEANRVASISYGKFSRNIATELSLPPEYRSYSGIDFVQICRTEFDRLIEQSPMIPLNILQKFMKEIENDDITKPDIMTVTKVEEYTLSKQEENMKSIINQSLQEGINRKNSPKKIETFVNKGIETIQKIQKMITPPSLKEIENQIEKEVEVQKENIEVELVKKKEELSIQIPKIPSVKNIKSNVLNIIHKAKNNLEEEVKEGYDSIQTDIENTLDDDNDSNES